MKRVKNHPADSHPRRAIAAPVGGRRPRLIWPLVALLLLLGGGWYFGALSALPLQFARQAIRERDPEGASLWLRRAEFWGAAKQELELMQARLQRRRGATREMDLHLERAQAAGADPEQVKRERVLAAAQTGRLDEVEAYIVAWLQDAGLEAPEICDAYSNGLARQGRLPEAQRVLDSWQADYPDDPEPHVKRGRIAEHDLQSDQAEQEYRIAIEKGPQYPPALYALGRLLLDRKRPQEALPLFEQCAKASPATAPAADVGAATCLRLLGRADEARGLLEAVLALDAPQREAAYQRVRDQPEGDAAAFELGQLEADQKNYEQAEKWLRQSLDKDPGDLEARYSLAVAIQRLGRREEAEREFEHVSSARKQLAEIDLLHDQLGEDRSNADVRYQIGVKYLQQQSQRAGVYWLHSALACNPQYAPAHQALADYYQAHAGQSAGYADLAEHHRRQAESSTTAKP